MRGELLEYKHDIHEHSQEYHIDPCKYGVYNPEYFPIVSPSVADQSLNQIYYYWVQEVRTW